jgi:hypothetical protein
MPAIAHSPNAESSMPGKPRRRLAHHLVISRSRVPENQRPVPSVTAEGGASKWERVTQ